MNAVDTHLREGLIGGASAESIAGGAAIVLTIVGLAGILPHAVLAISAMAIGAGLLVKGGAVAAEHRELMTRLSDQNLEEINMDVGISVELAGGLAAIVLGILSLLTIDPAILMPAAAVIVGGALLLSSGSTQRMNAIRMEGARKNQDAGMAARIAREAVNTSAAAQGFIGLGAVVLGILGLIGLVPYQLALVAFLAAGASMALSGSAIGSRLYGALKG